MTFAVILDQISKGTIQKMLLLGDERVLIPNLIKIVHVQNSATALGFVDNKTITIFSLLILLWALRRLIILRKSSWLKILPYVLIISGLSGNTIDRLIYGHVVSFFQVSSWIFNFSDILIAAALFLSLFNISQFFWNRNASFSV